MAAAPSVDRTLADPGSYRHWHTIVPRFRDLDVLGHVNHGSTVSWLEEGRVMLELPIQPIEELTARPVFVLAEMRLRFLAEVRMSDAVRVGTCILRLGRSSITLGQAVFAGDRAAVISEAVEVLIGQQSRKPEPLPPDYRAHLAQFVRAA